MPTTLTNLSNKSRIWVYGADRDLTESETHLVVRSMESFVDSWTAHGAGLEAGTAVLEDRFVVVAVDETQAAASGCSIDAMVKALTQIGTMIGCSFLNGTLVYHRNRDGAIQDCTRGQFRRLCKAGMVLGSTPVFDLTISTLEALRAGELEKPADQSWHGSFLPAGAVPAT